MKALARISGPLFALIAAWAFEIPAHPHAPAMLGIAAWMALWWITQCVPLAVTALIPVVAFPLAGVATAREVGPRYMTSIMFLFVGGFLIAQAMEKTGLHRRIALFILARLHAGPIRVLLGFAVATAFLSMWISNTATTMLMVTIALPVAVRLEKVLSSADMTRFGAALFLLIAYSANLGGMATPVGTVPNLVFMEMLMNFAPERGLTFVQWMMLGLPTMLVGILVLISLFAWRARSLGWPASISTSFSAEFHTLGAMSRDEKFVAGVLGVTALAWMTRQGIQTEGFSLPGWSALLPYSGIDDGTVAAAAALCLFLIPVSEGRPVLGEAAIGRLPWQIIVLLGGGFALAMGMQQSGLSAWIGGQLQFASDVPLPLMLMSIALAVTFLTEITSNTATTQVLLPILASVALASGQDVTMVLAVATLAASCAFMLPVATPPNAIVFGTQRIPLQDMLRAGIMLNLLMAGVLVAVVMLVRPLLP